MKKFLFMILISALLITACAGDPSFPALPDSPEPEQPSEPSLPDIPITPAEPSTPSDTPTEPDEPQVPTSPSDVPSTPDEPQTPDEPVQPEYPDISAFDRDNRSIVYAAKELKLIDPESDTTLTLSKDRALISLGNAGKYNVILYKGVLYLTDSSDIISEHPQACTAKEEQLGGTLYMGGEKIIVIDAGHQNKGMYDTEPVGPGSTTMKAKVAAGTEGISTKIAEYVLNLNVSLLLRDELISRGYTVVMIRETHDVRISNAERAQMANAYEADAFIRVHANGSDNTNARGALAIFQTAENVWCGNLYVQSRRLSELVLDSYCQKTGIENDGNWETDTMTGINWTAVPSTIIELGYMSNAEEDKLMSTTEFHRNAAIGIADGIDRYFLE